MDSSMFFTVLAIVFQVIMVILGVLTFLVHFGVQFFRKVPAEVFSIKFYDIIAFIAVGVLFGLGFDNTWAVGAFLPLLLWKYLAGVIIRKEKLKRGYWFEIKWQRLAPKGLNHIPAEQLAQMNAEIEKLPKDAHVLVPRFAARFGFKYFLKKLKEPQKLAPHMEAQANQARMMIEGYVKKIIELKAERTEKISLPLGVLSITRH